MPDFFEHRFANFERTYAQRLFKDARRQKGSSDAFEFDWR
jgi:hypothetical protein